jgi:peptide/nickel transport system permease protein
MSTPALQRASNHGIGPVDAAIALPRTQTHPRSRSRTNVPGVAVIGSAIVFGVAALAVLGPAVDRGNPLAAAGPALQPPSAAFPFGTDDLGRDVLLGVLNGARVSLLAGALAAATSAILGTLIGAAAGFYGRPLDDILMRLTEVVQVAPRFFLAVLVAALFGPSFGYLALLLGLTFWPQTARLLRAQILTLREREYVVAARAIGVAPARILRRHLLPNAASIVVITAALQVGAAILIEASLSFLGLGDRSLISWGYMLNNAQPFLRSAWWMSLFPGLALAITVLGTNLLADGVQAVLDPRRSVHFRR